jgi:hypothetical protein
MELICKEKAAASCAKNHSLRTTKNWRFMHIFIALNNIFALSYVNAKILLWQNALNNTMLCACACV